MKTNKEYETPVQKPRETCMCCLEENPFDQLVIRDIPKLNENSFFTDETETTLVMCLDCYYDETDPRWFNFNVNIRMERGGVETRYEYEDEILEMVNSFPLSGQELFYNYFTSNPIRSEEWIRRNKNNTYIKNGLIDELVDCVIDATKTMGFELEDVKILLNELENLKCCLELEEHVESVNGLMKDYKPEDTSFQIDILNEDTFEDEHDAWDVICECEECQPDNDTYVITDKGIALVRWLEDNEHLYDGEDIPLEDFEEYWESLTDSRGRS